MWKFTFLVLALVVYVCAHSEQQVDSTEKSNTDVATSEDKSPDEKPSHENLSDEKPSADQDISDEKPDDPNQEISDEKPPHHSLFSSLLKPLQLLTSVHKLPAFKPIETLTKADIINLHPEDDNEKVRGHSESYSSHKETVNGVTTVDEKKGDIVNNENGNVTEIKFGNNQEPKSE